MVSLGEELRRQRELRQISLREIADATKINIRFLEALEKNDYTHLPGGQFNKGFIRSYAGHIGIDAEKMIEAYLEEVERQKPDPPEREREAAVRAPNRSLILMALLLAALALVLAGGALLAWFTGDATGRSGRMDRTPAPAVASGRVV